MCIHEIRTALGDDAEAPQYIETVGRQGYRFLSGPMSQAPSPTSAGPVVGRQHEVAQLHQWYARAVGGERQFVVLSGELGIGKTTVVDLFLASLAPGARIGRGQCVEHYGEGEPYCRCWKPWAGRRGPGGDRVVVVLQRYAPLWLVQLSGLVPEIELERVQRRVEGATAVRMLRELAEALEVLTTETPWYWCSKICTGVIARRSSCSAIWPNGVGRRACWCWGRIGRRTPWHGHIRYGSWCRSYAAAACAGN